MRSVRMTSLQPDRDVYNTRDEALIVFIGHPSGWLRHTEGFVVLHDERCDYAEELDCTCDPIIVAMRQGEAPH